LVAGVFLFGEDVDDVEHLVVPPLL
jgi:hypothetical protein